MQTTVSIFLSTSGAGAPKTLPGAIVETLSHGPHPSLPNGYPGTTHGTTQQFVNDTETYTKNTIYIYLILKRFYKYRPVILPCSMFLCNATYFLDKDVTTPYHMGEASRITSAIKGASNGNSKICQTDLRISENHF